MALGDDQSEKEGKKEEEYDGPVLLSSSFSYMVLVRRRGRSHTPRQKEKERQGEEGQ